MFGFTQPQQNLYLWKQQLPQLEVGTITQPYPFDSQDQRLGWGIHPNIHVKHSKLDLWDVVISTDSNGMRGKKIHGLDSSNDTLKIGVFGASQTFGESVNDNEEYASIIEKRLQNSTVLNFGVRGYGTDQMLLRYKNAVKKYDFDIVILAFAFHHIPRNISSFTFHAKPYFEIHDDELILKGIPVPDSYHLYDTPVPDINSNILNKSIVMRYLLQYYRQYNSNKIYQDSSDAWKITQKIIKEFSTISEKHHSRFIIVNIEDKFEYLEASLERFVQQEDIEMYNLGPVLRHEASIKQGIYTNDNHHWTKLGHTIVAYKIVEYLQCNPIDEKC